MVFFFCQVSFSILDILSDKANYLSQIFSEIFIAIIERKIIVFNVLCF